MRKVLIIGGTGMISEAITGRLLAEEMTKVVHLNRGSRPSPDGVRRIQADRGNKQSLLEAIQCESEFDCVIDMAAFSPQHARDAVELLSGKTKQYVFCSTVDVYTKTAKYYPIDEAHERNPAATFPYACGKKEAEDILLDASAKLPVTIIRLAQTYGGTSGAIASIGSGEYQMRRLREGRPIIVHGDGSSLWVACHRDDAAAAFVNAIGNKQAVGRAFNVTGEEWMTFNQYWTIVAKALQAPVPKLVHIPTDLLQAMLPKRAEWCAENFRNVTIFDNSAAREVLGFRYTIRWEDGIRAFIRELDQRGLIAGSEELPFYDRLLERWEEHSCSLVQEIRPYED
ncbi:NAD-dependent epimerase/dehydratase family protein [Paenibacillus glycanilyticus]|uniref:NAD-dependent epimerase/dehydratase family protein n=1 Tax=Paenibacillus glycanilyticus TaxID=126569 RepID=UPI0013E3FB10|nr:NAD-dependent epimerase/dehydratase family protein [Paenibacillus glycanilyticus]